MNSERKAFEEVFTSSKGWDLTLINGVYQNQNTNNAYAGWKASANRKGYKLVPVDVLERSISHISIAMCHPNNTRNEEDIMHNDMVIIEEAMIGVVSNEE